MKWASTTLTFLKLEDAFFTGDAINIHKKVAFPKAQKTKMGQELLLGEDAIGLVNTAQDDRDKEYSCGERPTGQTAQLEKAK